MQVNAQKNVAYARYYEVKLKQSVKLETSSFSEKIKETPFRIHSLCSSHHTLLIAVPADYPKRIPAVKQELAQQFKKEISKFKEDDIKVIKVADLQSYCQ